MNAEDLRNEFREARGNGSSHANDSLFQRGKRIISAREFIASFEPPDLTVPRLNIRKRAVYTMTGRTGDGKTGIVLCLTLCKAAGWDLAGEAVPQGRVLILAGENPEDPLMRLILAQHQYGLSDDVIDRIMVLPHAFPLHEHADEVVAMATDHGPFDIAFIETAAAYFHGDDDSANMPMRDLAIACRSLIRIPGEPCVIVPAHPNKAADTPEAMVPRGGGAFLNEVDGNMSVFSTEKGVTTTLHWTGKWRGPTFEPITFRLNLDTAPRLKDKAGRVLYSVLAEPMTDAEAEKAEARQVDDHLALLETMIAVHPGSPSVDQLRQRLSWNHKSRVDRAMKRLAALKLVKKNIADHWELTKTGRDEGRKLMEKGAL